MTVSDLLEVINPLDFVRVYPVEACFDGDPLFEGEWRHSPESLDDMEVVSIHATWHGDLEMSVEVDQ